MDRRKWGCLRMAGNGVVRRGDGKDGDGTGVRQGSGARCVKGGMDGRMDGKGVGQGCVRMAGMKRRERWTKDGEGYGRDV